MKKALLFVAVIIVFLSCTKEEGVPGPAGPQGPAGPAGQGSAGDTGTVAGKLSLFNEFCLRETDYSGVIVTLTSGSLHLADTTGSTGLYQFSGLKTGTYNLTFQKTGYGTMKIFGLSFFAGDQLTAAVKDVYLIQRPVKTAIDSVYISYSAFPNLVIDIKLDTSSLLYEQWHQNFLLFAGKDKNVGPSNYIYMVGQLFTPDGNGGYSGFINRAGIPATDTVYVVVYTYNRYLYPGAVPTYITDLGDGGFYIDPQTGQYVFPNLSNPSKILKAIF